MSIKKGILIDLGMVVVIGIVGYIYLNTQQKSLQKTAPPMVQSATPTKMQTALANPASINCTKLRGTLTILKRGDGGEYGLCQFEDNQACEEWALFNKNCPVGGVKTTGYDTIDQKYCAWLGGRTLAEPNAKCTLPNGNVCKDIDLYNGTCS